MKETIILGNIIPIVSVALIQSENNNMIDAAQSHYPPNGNPPQF